MANYYQASYNKDGVASSEQIRFELFREEVLWKLLMLTALTYLVWSDKISIVFGSDSDFDAIEAPEGGRVRAALFDFSVEKPRSERLLPEEPVVLSPDALSNVTFAIDPAFADRNKVGRTEVRNRLAKCRDYLERFAPLAVAEMHASGVPASITLAQGLLESDAGESKLAVTANNHFGIKCFSKSCKKGHCVNFTDDSHKDFFVRYGSAYGSFQAHSRFLKNKSRYRQLFSFSRTDYRSWANGLAEAGYATDKNYGKKLIAIVQSLGLDRYDHQ